MNELEERLHSSHVHEEEALHEAHEREEHQLHQEHVQEEAELRQEEERREHEHHEHEHHEHEHHGEVTVIAPSGAPVQEKYHPSETVEALLIRARNTLAAEGQLDPSKEYVLVLGDTPLNNNLTLEAAGICAGATLKIRSKEIPGDGHAS